MVALTREWELAARMLEVSFLDWGCTLSIWALQSVVAQHRAAYPHNLQNSTEMTKTLHYDLTYDTSDGEFTPARDRCRLLVKWNTS